MGRLRIAKLNGGQQQRDRAEAETHQRLRWSGRHWTQRREESPPMERTASGGSLCDVAREKG